jgi:hypothetical protein
MNGMRLTGAIVLAAVCGYAEERLEAFGHQWNVEATSDWAVVQEEGETVLRLLKSGQPGVPRRPTKFAVADTPPFKRVIVECEMRRAGRSLIIVYAWQDKDHWNYAHVSSDEARKVNVHNGMFHVFGGERVRISTLDGPDSLAAKQPGKDWAKVKLEFDGTTGRATVEVDGRTNPSLEAVDLSLRQGLIGLGSFNETGDFRRVKITGQPF